TLYSGRTANGSVLHNASRFDRRGAVTGYSAQRSHAEGSTVPGGRCLTTVARRSISASGRGASIASRRLSIGGLLRRRHSGTHGTVRRHRVRHGGAVAALSLATADGV